MNIGKIILDLRKEKEITQEELAAELGVTAAAISKWENGYTLPDIMMLCALADYFGVSTDELLGRNKQSQYAVVVANEVSLGRKIQELAAGFGIQSKALCAQFSEAVEIIQTDAQITHLLLGHLGKTAPIIDMGMFSNCPSGNQEKKLTFYAEYSDNETDILSELERCLT